MRWSLESYLTRRYEVVTAATVDEACSIVTEASADVISLAIVADGLPDGPANAIIRQVRARNPRARIIQTVARSIRADGAPQRPADHVRVLEKPFRLEALDTVTAR